MPDLSEKVAVVTGAATGIGESIARRLFAGGARVVVVVVGHDESGLKQPFERHRSPAKFRRENDGHLVVAIVFPRFALSAEIQTSLGETPIDPLIAHNQADPGARDLWIGQIDILPDQSCALSMGINQSSADSIVPVE